MGILLRIRWEKLCGGRCMFEGEFCTQWVFSLLIFFFLSERLVMQGIGNNLLGERLCS